MYARISSFVYMCMLVYSAVCLYVCMYVFMYVCTYIFSHIHVRACILSCVLIRMYVCMYVCVCMHVYLQLCTCACLYTKLCACMCVCMHIFSHVNVHASVLQLLNHIISQPRPNVCIEHMHQIQGYCSSQNTKNQCLYNIHTLNIGLLYVPKY